MSKLILSILIFVFLPAFAQKINLSNSIRGDTALVIEKMKRISMEKKKVVDSIINIRHEMGIYVRDTLHRAYNVDYAKGKRVRWIFIYTIGDNNKDTLFQKVIKDTSRWKL